MTSREWYEFFLVLLVIINVALADLYDNTNAYAGAVLVLLGMVFMTLRSILGELRRAREAVIDDQRRLDAWRERMGLS